MERIGFLTDEDHFTFSDDDNLAVKALAALGIRVEPVVWSRFEQSLNGLPLVVVRSPWDYYQKRDEFSRFLDRTQSGR